MGAQLTYPSPRLSSLRTVIVTGGNTGIGYETAKAIAQMGARVIIACRSEQRAKEAIESMQHDYVHQKQSAANHGRESGDVVPPENEVRDQEDGILSGIWKKDSEHVQRLQLEFMQLDLTSLKSTMEFIDAYKEKGYPLHVLICNAGIANAKQAYTEDQFESQFQVNYLSHLLIILHLLPVMRRSLPDVRIILVSSLGHYLGTFDLENMQGQQSYGRLQFYANSKLYQVMIMYALQRRLQNSGITVTSLHPGQVKTEIHRNFQDSMLWSNFVWLINLLGLSRDSATGAATSINCAVNPELEGVEGVYFSDCKPDITSAQARDETAQEQLWDYSLTCLKDYLSADILKQFATTKSCDPASSSTQPNEEMHCLIQ